MKVGDKIRILREIKNISTKHMADNLDMSLGGYLKIERNDVDINIEKIERIATLLEVKPQDILSVDEKFVVNFTNNHFQNSGYNVSNYFPEELKSLYEDKISLLEERNRFLEEKISWLEKK